MSSSSDEGSIDLDLSCSFSDAESSASESEASDDPLGLASDAVVEPYMYEPLASDSEAGGDDTSAVDDGDSDERLLDTNWYGFVVLYLNLSMIL